MTHAQEHPVGPDMDGNTQSPSLDFALEPHCVPYPDVQHEWFLLVHALSSQNPWVAEGKTYSSQQKQRHFLKKNHRISEKAAMQGRKWAALETGELKWNKPSLARRDWSWVFSLSLSQSVLAWVREYPLRKRFFPKMKSCTGSWGTVLPNSRGHHRFNVNGLPSGCNTPAVQMNPRPPLWTLCTCDVHYPHTPLTSHS